VELGGDEGGVETAGEEDVGKAGGVLVDGAGGGEEDTEIVGAVNWLRPGIWAVKR
jgi:hypothetical protein